MTEEKNDNVNVENTEVHKSNETESENSKVDFETQVKEQMEEIAELKKHISSKLDFSKNAKESVEQLRKEVKSLRDSIANISVADDGMVISESSIDENVVNNTVAGIKPNVDDSSNQDYVPLEQLDYN